MNSFQVNRVSKQYSYAQYYINNRDFLEFISNKNFSVPANRKAYQAEPVVTKPQAGSSINWAVLLSTVLATCASLILVKKWQNRHISPEQVKAGHEAFVKTLNKINIFKNQAFNNFVSKNGKKLSEANHRFNLLNIKYGLPEMLIVSTSSIIGGLTGGLLFNKERSSKNKIKEAIFQFFNVAVPTVFVAGLVKVANNKTVLDKLPRLLIGKSNITKTVLNIAALLGGVFTGMHTGAFISNHIIDKIYKVPDSEKRNIKLKDFLIHSDDLLGAVALTRLPLLSQIQIEKLLPALYSMGGYHAGNGE